MNLLVIGASGHVGTLVNPFLKRAHTLRIYDLKPPADPTLDFLAGDVCDIDGLRSAMQGMDGLLFMASTSPCALRTKQACGTSCTAAPCPSTTARSRRAISMTKN